MMLHKLQILLLVPVLAFAFIGCSDDGDFTTIEGSLALELPEGETGFDFESAVPLVSAPEDASSGCAAGECVMSLDAQGEPASLDIWLQRGLDGDQGLGFRTFEVSLTEGSAAVAATVAATNGEETFYGSGGANCAVSDLSSVEADGTVALVVDCELFSDDNETIHATADVLIEGCIVQ